MITNLTQCLKGLGLSLSLAAAIAFAQGSPKIQTTVSIDLASKYVWHGVTYVNDWVMQPSVSLSTQHLTLTLWSDVELSQWNHANYACSPRNRFTELDSSLEYDGALKGGSWSFGYADRQYPGTGAPRYQEWYATLGSEDAWGAPTLTVTTAASCRTGTYATLALGYSMRCPSLGEKRSMDLAAELTFGDSDFNKGLYGRNVAAFSDLHLSLGTTCEAPGGWTLTPTLHYSMILHDHLDAYPRQTNVWLNLGFAHEF